MFALRPPRVLLRAFLLLGTAALVSSCRVDTSVDVVVGDDGAGQVQVNAGFDDEALARAGDLRLDDVRAAGWTVTGPQKEPERDTSGRTWVHATKPFSTGAQLTAIMNEINGPNGIFRDFGLRRTTGFAKVTYTLSGTIDATGGLESFSDPEVAQLLGGNSLGRPTADLQKDAANLTLVFSATLPGDVSGAADQVDGGRAQWNIALDRAPIAVDVHSTDVQGAARRWAAIAAALALGALVVGVMAFVRRPQRRLDAQVPSIVFASRTGPARPSAPVAPTAPRPERPPEREARPERPPEREARPELMAVNPPRASAEPRPASQKRIQVVVLDAMGVLFRDNDDVETLLIPFVHERGGIDDPLAIRARYVDASLGRHTTAELWALLGVDGDPSALDRAYTERYVLSDGVHEFLDAMDHRDIAAACLTNDVTEWSALLRRRFALDGRVRPWIVSGDVGIRKPDARIFAALQSALDVPLRACLLVDDRTDNLAAAKKVGMSTVHFARDPVDGSPYRRVGSLFELFSRGRVTS